MLAGSTLQRAISTSHKELVCNSNMLPFVLYLLALRNYSQSYLNLQQYVLLGGLAATYTQICTGRTS